MIIKRLQQVEFNGEDKVGIQQFYNYNKMSSNSLISSLFRDNSFNSRSSSMFSKNFTQQSAQERSRSQSITRNKNSDQDQTNRNHPLNRLAHIISVKLKKHNYFLFCRLEANLKKYRTLNKKQLQNSKLSIQKQLPKQQSIASKSSQQMQMAIKGAESMCETLLLINSKENQCTNLSVFFKKIVKKSNKVKGLTCMIDLVNRYRISNLRKGMDNISYWQKISLKMDILNDAYEPLLIVRLKNAFSIMRQFAIDVMLEQQNQRRQQQAQEKLFYNQCLKNPHFNQLKQISEEQSMASQEDTARFIQFQQDTRRSSEDITFRHLKQFQVDSAITPRKESRKQWQSSHSKKKQQTWVDDDEQYQEKNRNQSGKKKPATRTTTKIQAKRQVISFCKALKIQTELEDKDAINSQHVFARNMEKMKKSKNIFAESITQTVPDHDNISFFHDYSTKRNTVHTINTMKTNEDGCYSARGSKNINHKTSDFLVNQFNSDLTNQLFSQSGHHNQVSSSENYIFSSPKFREQPNQGTRTPLTKIQQMILDLERISQNGKSKGKKSTNGYHKCKISVNLPRKNIESNHNSGQKYTDYSVCRGNTIDWVSEKRNKREVTQNIKPWSIKQTKQKEKQNFEVKLWDQKQKFLFYPDSNGKIKERKKNSTGYISSMDHSLMNSARKTTTLMKKQIENIRKNNSKSRISLANLKLARNKA